MTYSLNKRYHDHWVAGRQIEEIKRPKSSIPWYKDHGNRIRKRDESVPYDLYQLCKCQKREKSIVFTIKNQLYSEWEKYSYIFQELSELQQKKYHHLKKVLLSEDETLSGIDDAISFLMEMLYRYYNKNVMVFIDEYDTPFVESHVNGFYEEIRNGLSLLLHNSLKTSDYLQYAMLTGIQRVAKENIFSDLNNVEICTVASEGYNKYFGFTSEETQKLLTDHGLELTDAVKRMYDGYRIGNIDIYNPWSIIYYARTKTLQSYWVNTSSNVMIKNAIKQITKRPSPFESLYKKLITDGQLETIVSLETSFYENATVATLWGYFVNAGYLTIEKVIDAPRKNCRDIIRK